MKLDFDAIVIGAGIAGLYQLYKLREIGMKVRVFEEGKGVGGTWYWNRYPGARFDSESISYAYSFSKELLDEWDWSEHFASQPEILRYLQYVAKKFDLLKDIQFSSNVKSAEFNENNRTWEITLSDGRRYRSRFLITGVGNISQPTMPTIQGMESFRGPSFHTARWPHNPIDFTGKKVAVIGTGASGGQVIQEICKNVEELTVFQRRPNWCTPLQNAKIYHEEMEQIRSGYDEMFAFCDQSQSGFLHIRAPRGPFEVTEKERNEFWEHLYNLRGFSLTQGNFKDVFTNPKANKAISDFVAEKIRSRVNDPDVAEKLIPKDHGFGTRRVPLETNYFESYNLENVELVDIKENPIERITSKGILTKEREFSFDLIIYATGFDVIFGSFDRINICGTGNLKLKDQWKKELSTFLGLQVNNFPNFFMIMGPHALLGNNPRSIEYNVEWITSLLQHMNENDLTIAEPDAESVASWHDYVMEKSQGILANQIDSWATGVNSNLQGRQKRIVAVFSGTQAAYRGRCDEVALGGYKELNLS